MSQLAPSIRRRPAATNTPAGRPRRWLALASALVLLALTGGVPAVLLTVAGSPVPDQLPSLQSVGRALLRPDDGTVLVTVLLAIAWLSWLAFTASVLAEVPAVVRGRASRRIAGLSMLQGVAAQLLTSAAVLLPTLSTTTAGMAAVPVAVSVPAVTAPLPGSTAPTGDSAVAARSTAAAAPAAPAPALPMYVVQSPHDGRRDTLWTIAAEHLGDPLRWHEIAALNMNRLQPDGARLTDPHWIRPGWRLLMPADATAVRAPAAAAVPAPVTAAGARPPATAGTSVAPTTAEASPAGQPTADRVHAGAPAVPRQPAAPTTRTPPASAVPTRAAPAPADTGRSAGDRAAPPTAEDSDRSHPVVLAGLAVLAAGVLAGLAGLRRVQRRHRRPGERIAAAPAVAARTESRLRVAAEPDRLDLAARAIDALSPLASAGTMPAVAAVEIAGDTVRLHLVEPQEPCAPFRAVDAATWQVSAEDLTGPDGPAAALLPTLVTVGHDDGRELLADLESCGTLAVDGPAELARQLLEQFAVQLGTAPWAGSVTVHLVGFGADLAGIDLERLRIHPRLSAALVDQFSSHAAAADRLRDGIHSSRLADAAEPWPTEVALVAAPTGDGEQSGELLAGLLAAGSAGNRCGIAVVLAGSHPAATTLRLHEDGWCDIDWLNRRVRSALLPAGAAADVSRLFAAAQELRSHPPTPPAVPPRPAVTEQPPADPAVPVDDRDDVARPTPPAGVEPEQPAPPPTVQPVDVAEPKCQRNAAPVPAVVEDDPLAAASASTDSSLDEAVDAYLNHDPDRVRIRLLGAVEVHATGLVRSNRVAVCTESAVFLASHPDGVTPEQYDAALWPDTRVRPSTRHEVIARTRKWLGDGPDGTPHLPHAERGRGRIRLSAAVLVDWQLFCALVERAQLRTGPARIADWEKALSLVGGAPFQHVPADRYGWLAGENLEEDMTAVITDVANDLAEEHLAAGNLAEARRVARHAHRVDRADERAWRVLLRVEAVTGNVRRLRDTVRDLLTATDVDAVDELLPETATLITEILPQRTVRERATG